MKIGIDIHSIGSGKGGNDTYYRYLLAGLSRTDSKHNYLLFGTENSLAAVSQLSGSDFQARQIANNSYARIAYSLPTQLRREQVDVFLAQFIVPPFLQCRTVAAILDLAFERVPECFSPYQRMWSKVLIRSSAHRADHIVTLSEHSKRDIVNTYDIPEEKITVTYLGAGEEFVPRDKETARDYISRKYGIHTNYILYLGRLQARKNLGRVVSAYAHVRKAGFPHRLVLAGKRDYLFEPVLGAIEQLGLTKDVLLPGYTPLEDVPWLYAAADAFVFVPFYEGFGLPAIEAMACGIPVITSRGTSLEEVVGDAALLIDPYDETSIANAMRRVLEDSELRNRLIRAGLQRSAQFNHAITAQQTLSALESASGLPRVRDAKSLRQTPAERSAAS